MANQKYSPTEGEVVGTTDVRQGNSKKMNLRILIFSTTLLALIFAGFLFGFFSATPPQMDGTAPPTAHTQPSGTMAPATNTAPEAPAPANPDTSAPQNQAPAP
ncbi:hypothetical protein [Hyphomicrobium methylovorum]|uniref:hypothetical protein n=1 Tax=Hyphomicrobium methylovorum TaxID=84 RepID=UPI0015E7A301|nr:hypothetical protein [Hyphomicrobium methylovorum]